MVNVSNLNNKLLVFLLLFSLSSFSQPPKPSGLKILNKNLVRKSNQISVGGVTWTFDTTPILGQYANGDYWVLGPVKIVSISPDFDGMHNGWEVNPIPGTTHGFDSRMSGFNKNLVPALPYDADTGQSIVKTISITPYNATPRPVLKSASVLTVVGSIPPGNGSEVFRPPYVKTSKPLYYLKNIKRELIEKRDSVDFTPDLLTVNEWFKNVQLNHVGGSASQYSRPSDNLPYYGADLAKRTADCALRLLIPGDEELYTQALISYLQCGLDYYHMINEGWIWPRAGGEQPGEKLPITFFVTLLGDETMKSVVRTTRMYEDYMAYYGKDSIALYGDWGWSSQKETPDTQNDIPYWNIIANGLGSKTQADPYGYIDGGMEPGGSYQFCCTSQPFKGTVLALLLMPALQDVWNPRALIDYVDRWVTKGTWTQPDPCACVGDSADYQIKWGPDPNNPGDCIKDGIGRFPQLHGTNIDGGLRKSSFQSAMWDAYRTTK